MINRLRIASGLLLFAAAGYGESAQAPQQVPVPDDVRICLERNHEENVEACHKALALGISPTREVIVRLALARKLGTLKHWDEVVQVYRDLVHLRPNDADAWLRLGAALLHVQDRGEEAAARLREAVHLKPDWPEAHALLGAALNALGRHAEAVAAFEEAIKLAPDYLRDRPVARLTYEASRRGQTWPPAP